MHYAAFSLCCVAVLGQARPESTSATLRAGKPFAQALALPIAATWKNVDLRTIVRIVAESRGTAILLDRRLDPTCSRSLAANGEALQAFLERLAEAVEGRASVVGNVVYLGPPDTADKLRTLIFLRQQELSAEEAGIPRTRRLSLSQLVNFGWDELDRPAELISRLAQQRQLAIVGLELVPHDLWAGAILPQATAAEALSLILIQWDLTFKWQDEGRGIRLVPVPARVAIERKHLPPGGQTATAALASWREHFPDLDARVAEGAVLVQGSLERHEAIERLRRPARPAIPASEANRLKPLKLERFTLQLKDQPLRSLLEKLSQPAFGIVFEYDVDALRQAGVNLDQRVTFEVSNATFEQLLKAALAPLKLDFELSGRTVRLKPALQ